MIWQPITHIRYKSDTLACTSPRKKVMIIQSREIQDFSWNFFPNKVSNSTSRWWTRRKMKLQYYWHNFFIIQSILMKLGIQKENGMLFSFLKSFSLYLYQ